MMGLFMHAHILIIQLLISGQVEEIESSISSSLLLPLCAVDQHNWQPDTPIA